MGEIQTTMTSNQKLAPNRGFSLEEVNLHSFSCCYFGGPKASRASTDYGEV